MYSVAFDSTVALLSLCAGVRPSRSSGSSSSSPLPLPWDIIRRLGTLSRKAAILSFRLLRYLFSIMLWAVFLTGGCLAAFRSVKSSSEADFRFLLLLGCAGSGDDCDDELVCILVAELGLCCRLGVEWGGIVMVRSCGCS